MIGAQTNLTPTQEAAVAQHRAFRARIAAQAVPDAGFTIKAPLVREVPKTRKPTLGNAPWFYIVSVTRIGAMPSLNEIIALVAKHSGLSRDDILSDHRLLSEVRARQIVMYLAKTLTRLSYPEIGRRLSRDHSTVLHGARKITRLINEDPAFAKEIDFLKAQLEKGGER